MSGSSRNDKSNRHGPDLDDCQRLWDTLTKEFVTDLAIRFEFQASRDPHFRARLIVWSPGFDPDTGKEREHVWAIKELRYGYEAITYIQLYDLLIIAYRVIEAHLGGQIELPLR